MAQGGNSTIHHDEHLCSNRETKLWNKMPFRFLDAAVPAARNCHWPLLSLDQQYIFLLLPSNGLAAGMELTGRASCMSELLVCQSFYVRLPILVFFFFFFLVVASSMMPFLHYFSQPCRRPERSTVCIPLLIITVNSLHTNEFHSESTFVSPVFS